MRRPSRPKAKYTKSSKAAWNVMWQSFCPWVMGQDVSPLQPARIKSQTRNPLRSLILALATVGAVLLSAPTGTWAGYSDQAPQGGQLIFVSAHPQAPAHYPALFGASEHRYTDIRPFTKWNNVLARFERNLPKQMNQPKTQKWLRFMASLKNESVDRKIEAVNDYMNQVAFISDQQNYGEKDHWATPMEFLARGGDCEDYAVAKYVSLRTLGVAKEQMRIAIVYDNVMRMPHAVLVVYQGDDAKILDNQNPAMLSANDISRYKPIYSISQTAWWRH